MRYGLSALKVCGLDEEGGEICKAESRKTEGSIEGTPVWELFLWLQSDTAHLTPKAS